MSAQNREAAISKTLVYEGGYVNHPSDPGGATNYGITIHDVRKYVKSNASPADVKALTKSQAIEIYRHKYWGLMECDERPAGVDFAEFDFGVNSGTARALKWRAEMDPLGLTPVNYVKRFCAKRQSFLEGLKTFSVFGRGWTSRVADVEATAVTMALKATGKPVTPVLKKEASNASKKAIGHTTAGTASGASLPALPDIDVTSKAGMVFFGICVAAVVAYFVWNAVQQSHRARAYKEAIQ